jgi:hypothetical protein
MRLQNQAFLFEKASWTQHSPFLQPTPLFQIFYFIFSFPWLRNMYIETYISRLMQSENGISIYISVGNFVFVAFYSRDILVVY